MSIQAEAFFEAEFKRRPTEKDFLWMSGYDKARADNGNAMTLMEQEIYKWRGGQLQFIGHRNEAREMRKKIADLESELGKTKQA